MSERKKTNRNANTVYVINAEKRSIDEDNITEKITTACSQMRSLDIDWGETVLYYKEDMEGSGFSLIRSAEENLPAVSTTFYGLAYIGGTILTSFEGNNRLLPPYMRLAEVEKMIRWLKN